MSDIEKILKNSTKAELLEKLTELLADYDNALVVLYQDNEKGGFSEQLLLLGGNSIYETCGIIEVAKHDLLMEW
jgi:hypothetical protein